MFERLGGAGRVAFVFGTMLVASLPLAAQAKGRPAVHAEHAGGHAAHAAVAHAGGGSSRGSAVHTSGRGLSGHVVAVRGGMRGHGRLVADVGGRRGRHGYGGAWVERVAFRSVRGGISCVPFAREETGIEVAGNAADWWDNAAGVYERGSRPAVGSVLNFRANGRMRLGHVAVVEGVTDSRHVAIDHANWSGPGAMRGGVSRGIEVVDVSPNNDWTAVRVELGHSGDFGSIYPTYGFIYPRGQRAPAVITASASAPVPSMNPAPRDLRPASQRSYDEVAEAPAGRAITLVGPYRLR